MKVIIIAILVIAPLLSKAQMTDSLTLVRQRQAADEVMKYKSGASTGLIMEMLGGAFVVISSANDQTKDFVVAGGILGGLGLLINQFSSYHLAKAINIMNGNTLVIPIGSKKYSNNVKTPY